MRKKLQPPFFHALPGWQKHFNEVPYLYKIFPEIIWQGFLNEKYGVRVASTITLKLLKIIQVARQFEEGYFFCFISNFELLTPNQIDEIKTNLFLDADYKKINEALLPFIKVFPECPLSKLQYSSPPKYNDADLMYVKSIFTPMLNKLSKEATFTLASVIYYAFELDMLHVAKDSMLLKLNQIHHYPDTEESEQIASTLRATANFLVHENFLIKKSEWQKYFWNRAYKLEPYNIDNLYIDL